MDNEERLYLAKTHAMYKIADILKAHYEDFDHHNKKDPLDELLFIICSVRTSKKYNEVTYEALRHAFPALDKIIEAPTALVAEPLSPGGFKNWKAETIKTILERLTELFAQPTLDPLESMSDEGCEHLLTSLPQVGKKIARCVMMYSLNRDVFPVDTNCWRVSIRLGWIEPSRRSSTPSPKDMDRLQDRIPVELRFSLHVNMVSLGRHICLPKVPLCGSCPISTYCPKIGVSKSSQ